MDEADLKSMAAGGEEHQTAIIDNVRVELAMAKSQVRCQLLTSPSVCFIGTKSSIGSLLSAGVVYFYLQAIISVMMVYDKEEGGGYIRQCVLS